jgi:hypothetical protein
VVNHLAKRGRVEPGSELFGKAFESWVHHELQAHRAYREFAFELSYWRTASGIEVDFLVDDVRVAIEAKASTRVHDGHLRGLREIQREHPRLKRRVVVSLDPRVRRTADGIEILPASSPNGSGRTICSAAESRLAYGLDWSCRRASAPRRNGILAPRSQRRIGDTSQNDQPLEQLGSSKPVGPSRA